MTDKTDALIESIDALADDVRAMKEERKSDHRRVVVLMMLVAYAVGASVVLFRQNGRLDDAQGVARANTCATDGLWLRLIAESPPPKTEAQKAKTAEFKARFEAEYAANRCSEIK